MTARAYPQTPAGATRADGYLVAMRIALRTKPIGLLGCLLACALACLLSGPLAQSASGEPAWTTYHRDSVRSGDDPDATEPIAPTLAWHSQDLRAPIYSQPLILGSRVYAATVADDVFALDAATGAIIWQKNVGTPVPAGALPCGNILPTVGIVGTPVIDPSTNAIYAVADTWDGSEAHHVLKGLSLTNGEEVLSTPVDPPGADPRAILQRTALSLDAGRVIFGYGGNYGDCSDYYGWVVGAPQAAGAPLYWHVPVAPPSPAGGAIWAPSGPAVGPEGNIYATTGNPDPPEKGAAKTYDYSDSVVQLTSSLDLIGSFAPPNWEALSNNDLDLSSAGAELLPGGLLFQAGKDGVGYLIDEATMGFASLGMPGAPAVFEAQVCRGEGSYGGDAYAAGVIYIACKSGVQALAYNQAARTFTPLWQGPVDAFGPPIVSGGLVWDVASGGFKGAGTTLYGLDPATGVPRYTLTLPSPVADHFASPSAAGARLFVATGSTESAYQISALTHGAAAGAATAAAGSSPPPASRSLVPTLLHKRLRADRKGRLHLTLHCPTVAKKCKGKVTLRAKLIMIRRVGKKHVRRVIYITLASARYSHTKGPFTVTIRLPQSARTLLRRHQNRLAIQVIVASPPGKARKIAASLTAPA